MLITPCPTRGRWISRFARIIILWSGVESIARYQTNQRLAKQLLAGNPNGVTPFPRPETPSSSRGGDPGMTLRDYFAAAALRGICAGGALAVLQQTGNSATGYAKGAYLIADEMIKARAA